MRERPNYLTRREIQVIDLVCQGMTNDDICAELQLDLRTVKGHVARALRKTRCYNRVHLALNWACPIFHIGLCEMGILPPFHQDSAGPTG